MRVRRRSFGAGAAWALVPAVMGLVGTSCGDVEAPEAGVVEALGALGPKKPGTANAVPCGMNPAACTIGMMTGGGDQTVVVKADGKVWAWGRNANGEVGDGTGINRYAPVPLTALDGFTFADAGELHSLAAKADGTVWAWGYNAYGQLGDGTTIQRLAPVQVSGIGDVIGIVAGFWHSMALKSDGSVWGWGDNSLGQLGDNTTTGRLTAVQVNGLSDVISMSGNFWHSVVAKKDGSVWAWGWNGNGQLGDGSTVNRTSPVQTSGIGNVIAVSAGYTFTVALRADGSVWTWGQNDFGQLGDGTTTARLVPTQVPGLGGVVAVGAGAWNTVVLKQDGSVWAWGRNHWGQVGDGTTTNRTVPVQVNGLTGIIAIAAGDGHNLALKSDGSLWAWGYNGVGELGDGTLVDKLSPVQVAGINLAVPAGPCNALILPTCLPLSNVCGLPPPFPDGTPCTDNDACTQTDACQSGVCTGQNPVVCAALDQCRDAGICDSQSGLCSDPVKLDGVSCDDGNLCTIVDTCQSGTCTSGAPVLCAPLDQCHDAGLCDSQTGLCSDPVKPDGVACDDGDLCTVADACQAGTCIAGAPVICQPLDQCHTATCDPQTGVCDNTAAPDGSPCDDNDPCTLDGSCQSGICTSGSPVVCAPLDQCHDAGVCDAQTGLCTDPQKVDGSSCDDNDACTLLDTCQSGACFGQSPVMCQPLDECHEAGTCDPQTGLCTNPAKNDETPCSTGVCFGGACTSVPACNVQGEPCLDGNACTVGDTCQAKACSPGPVKDCGLPPDCRVAFCDPKTGECIEVAAPDLTPCTNGVCIAGGCFVEQAGSGGGGGSGNGSGGTSGSGGGGGGVGGSGSGGNGGSGGEGTATSTGASTGSGNPLPKAPPGTPILHGGGLSCAVRPAHLPSNIVPLLTPLLLLARRRSRSARKTQLRP